MIDDVALAIFWMFHGTDNDMNPPILGHIADGEIVLGRLNNKVFRRLNSLCTYLTENNVVHVPGRETFAQRKKDLINFNRSHIFIVV